MERKHLLSRMGMERRVLCKWRIYLESRKLDTEYPVAGNSLSAVSVLSLSSLV